MSVLLQVLHDGVTLGGGASVLYTSTVAATAVTSVAARSSDRRRDARETLKVLLGRRPSR
ncbi:hypothetical protein ACKI14_31370 [Streptomyces turgidiscabies]|uniref:Uncharacterized protein n=1 Tax=Streptomyces turgidiscabies (strain Car8) TaxID=698760 RepID=L7FCT5_STRT8|nr:hypothetical protein STRTUCAR8_03934 [Streptomyces turgidiscabies Car8]GAQ68874.1 hypothetical protein T45_00591 [Streptomyces turgidiscabies]